MTIIDRIGSWTALLRRHLAVRPWVRWIVLSASAALFLAAVADHRRQLSAERDAWGDTQTVWVTDAPTEPGRPIAASPVERPTAVLPDDPVADDPSGSLARQAIEAGEIVVGLDVASRGAPADLIPDGWLAVPIVEAASSWAAVGEHVVVTTDGVVVTDEAKVVAEFDGAPLVAVPADVAAVVALANDSGVTLLRRP